MGIYFPLTSKKLPFWRWFIDRARSRSRRPYLLIGDFNTGKHYEDEAGATFWGASYIDELEALGYVNVWRRFHPGKREYTWFSHKGNGFRVDHAFASAALSPHLRGAYHSHQEREDGISDHSVLVVDLEHPNGA